MHLQMSFPALPLPKRKDSDYAIGELLGRGNFVTVYSATEIPTGKTVAIKVVDRYRAGKLKKANDLVMEKHCLLRLNHHNIVKMLGHFTDTLTVYVVMEECRGGELWYFVKTKGCPDDRARHYFGQILDAMEYMRQCRIVHRDLKAENVMLTDLQGVKLIDFGTAKDLERPDVKPSFNASRNRVLENYVGTPQFMPPEVIENKSTDNRSDTWSLGCLFYQVLAGLPPFHAASEYLVFLRVMKVDLEFPPGVSPVAEDLIRKMVVKEADDRLGALNIEEVRRHPYFADDGGYRGCYYKPAPLFTLADLCLRSVCQHYKTLKGDIPGWIEQRSQELSPRILDVLERMLQARKWQDDALPPDAEEDD